jgi:hypothetical protein
MPTQLESTKASQTAENGASAWMRAMALASGLPQHRCRTANPARQTTTKVRARSASHGRVIDAPTAWRTRGSAFRSHVATDGPREATSRAMLKLRWRSSCDYAALLDSSTAFGAIVAS